METYLQGFADPTETARVLMLVQKTDAKIFDRINVQLAGSNFLFAHTLLVQLSASSPCFALVIEQHVAALTITLTHQYIW